MHAQNAHLATLLQKFATCFLEVAALPPLHCTQIPKCLTRGNEVTLKSEN